MNKRILIIATSNSRMGESGKPTGIWAEELAVPYFAFADAGVQVEIASPAGGPLPLDPGSVKPRGQNDAAVERFLADADAQARAKASHPVSRMDAASFDAIFFPGGHGTMWDLPGDAGVTRAVETAFRTGKVIASVCHGAAGLVTARRPDGRPVVEGKKINSFTDEEESAVGLAAVVPFHLEARLRELGARFEGAPNWQPFAIRDGQFVTGQNPQSSKLVAQCVLEALGLAFAHQAA